MCKCISYNLPEKQQTDASVVMRLPFPNKPVGEPEVPHKKVSIDFCIANTIKHLWENGIYTKGSCCNHNKGKPSIVVNEKTTKEEADKIRKIIKEVDGRDWIIYSWILTKI